VAATRKFGMFGGVFTPSILTILGVIMYMRLPWIVGNAGMWTTMGIVVVAHTIAITTGLSVSSMATDKRVKAGGSYFILSRSLGLPIGGTLGLAMFVGLSFGVSLYVIGFSESFLSYMDWELSTTNIRICGGTVLFIVTAVTFISTALAIKTQYFIMAAIVLSLVSVLIGSDAPPPELPLLHAPPDAVALPVLFGIFFPAVTGFEAGVSMSGDLRDPRRDIPLGTLSAIAVGLVVYLALTAFLSYRIPGDQLAGNPSVLLDYAWKSELVLPGIWGATISSALGSILGAPRILQACAADRIGPAIFAKGYGPANEPRNAVVLTFLIALSGILIGELDVIARVVTMFFMTAYGFLNLACVIESTVSPDFRPEFRIPRFVPLLGAGVSALLMIQLDPLGMAGAVLVMGLLYLVLRRNTQRLEGGDSWAGVWTRLVQWGLDQLRESDTHERNWRPVLISFAGGSGNALGSELVGASVTAFGEAPGRQAIAEGPDRWTERAAACRFHGLPGLEPNCVLVETEDALADPAGFRGFLRGAVDGGYTVLLHRDTGKPHDGKRIDAWTRGGGANLSLQLALIRLLLSGPRWSDARVRFIAEVPDAAARRMVEHRLAGWLRAARVPAEVRVLVRGEVALDQLSRLSAEADLTILGMPQDDEPSALSARLSSLLGRVGSALLVHAAPSFSDPLASLSVAPTAAAPTTLPTADLVLPSDAALAAAPERFHREVRDVLAAFIADTHRTLHAPLSETFAETDATISRSLRQLARAAELEPDRRERMQGRVRAALLDAVIAHLGRIASRCGGTVGPLEAALSALDDGLAAAVLGLDERVWVALPRGTDQSVTVGDPSVGAIPRLLRQRRVPLRADTIRAIAHTLPREVDQTLLRQSAARMRALVELDGWLAAALQDSRSPSPEVVAAHTRRTAAWEKGRRDGLQQELRAQAALAGRIAQDVVDLLVIPKRSWSRSGTPGGWIAPTDVAAHHGQMLALLQMLVARSLLDAQLQRAVLRLERAVHRAGEQLRQHLDEGLGVALDAMIRAVEVAGERDTPAVPQARPRRALLTDGLLRTIAEAIDAAIEPLPATLQVVDDAGLDALERGELAEVQPREIALARLVGFVLESELLAMLRAPARELEAACRRAEDALAEAGRLLQAEDTPAEPGDVDPWQERQTELLAASAARLQSAREHLRSSTAALEDQLRHTLESTRERMRGATIIGGAETLGRFIRTRERTRLLSRVGELGTAAVGRAAGLGVELSYRWSSGVLAARALGEAAPSTLVEDALSFRSQVAPRTAVLDDLPLPYRRAFGRHPGPDALRWSAATEAALAGARRALADGRGALLVTGAPGAGASALLEQVVRAAPGAVVRVEAPRSATAAPAALEHALRSALGASGRTPIAQVLATLPHDAVIVLRDLERWWLRAEGGLAAIDRLCGWIDATEQRRWLLGCGTPSLSLLRQLTPLPALVGTTLTPPPLDAGALRTVIGERHASTGLELWVGERGVAPSRWQLARLYSALFDHSGGRVGPALSGWLAHITEAHADGVVVRRAEPVETDALDRLPPAWVAALTALALHRRLDADGLAATTGAQADPALLRALQRAGLIDAVDGVYELDRFCGPHIARWLTHRGVLA